jgi:hypothetical protein
VAAADADADGDMDLFIGTLADAKKYGYAQDSYLLLNDGKGRFTQAGNDIINLKSIGMVSSAVFADIDADNKPDLVIAGEWMPVKVFHNEGGRFTAQDLPGSTGLWQSLALADVNADGQPDLLAGNWGMNSKLSAGMDGPLKLYIKDFDNNGSIDQVMAYNKGGKEYTFLAKDELERQMPLLKKAYLTYNEVAGKDVEYMFYDLFKDYIELKAEIMQSSVFINKSKGQFQRQDLPASLQEAPVFSFASAGGESAFLAGGNFYETVPYEGRYDGQALAAFRAGNGGNLVAQSYPELFGIRGQVRDLKWLRSANGDKIMIVARNNEPLLAMRRKP